MTLLEDGDGEKFWKHEMNIDSVPITICTDDKEPEAEQLISNFINKIESIWGELYSTLESGFKDYGHIDEFPPKNFFLNLLRMTPEFYQGDKSDLLIRFEFDVEDFSDKLPFYDFYINNNYKIVHHQPVF